MDRRFTQVKDKDIARFWAKVNKGEADECWEWTASKVTAGYGFFSLYGFTAGSTYCMAHVFSYWLHNQEDPIGFLVAHKCDNPGCVNPLHLYKATTQQNTIDASKSGLINKGSGVWTSKLTDEIVTAIIKDRQQGYTQNALAKKYAISQSVVSRICTGHLWKHVTKTHGIEPKYKA